ncbi:right-handed parallel beta-helix repeat-containing protein [Cellulomonas oligotrophica]|uniref:Right handed beta helix domain-containing protein n=1 Tax=Cellulomonas oligotrophica TaxID=931536 RepID=A0A7Y9FHJ5_9CELL|nr:right-handed parallel beta-helix repeat-containing protein [Cellulomonas oligotrophica]NYD87444.1 hypothetical protein [Cellulomonas oligotrophica]GIG34078.1 hypothetical protein Col01nite_32370 [Cellulomonas oligotrophica]
MRGRPATTARRPRRTRHAHRSGTPGRRTAAALATTAGLVVALVVAVIAPASSTPAPAYRPLSPARVLTGTTLEAGGAATVTLPSVPAGATTATLQVTTGQTTARSTAVTVCPADEATCSGPTALTVPAGEPGSATVTVPVSQDRPTVVVRTSAAARVFVDLHGYGVDATQSPAATDSLYVPVDPRRAVETTLTGRGATTVTIPGAPAGATAVAVRLSSTAASSETSYVAVCPADQAAAGCATTSTLNPLPGRARQASTVVRLSPGARLQLFNLQGTHDVALDVDGFWVPAAAGATGGTLETLDSPETLADTVVRSGASATLTLDDVPTDATAVQVRLRATGAWRPTTVAACPGSTASDGCRETSFLVASPDVPAHNQALIPLVGDDQHEITLTSSAASVRLTPEIVGWVVGTGGATVAPPTRTATPTPTPTRTATPTPTASPKPTATPTATATPKPTASATPTPTAKPTPTPTPAPTAAPAPGAVKPGPTNTGVPAGTKLTVHQGDLTLGTPGQVVEGLDVRGFVKVTAPGVTIRKSIVRGTATTIQRSLVSTSAGASVTVEDSELYAQSPSAHIDGFRGQDITVRRSNIHHVIDHFHLTGGNVTVESSWLHDNLHYTNDPLQGGTPSHDDSIQIQVGSNIRITGNTIEDATNSGIQFTQDRGVVSDVRITKNWLDGGGCTVNLAEKGKGAFQGVVITDNVFGRDTRVANCAIIAPSTTMAVMTAARNTFTDGTAVKVSRGD